MIGSIGVFRQEKIHKQTAELGYYIAQEYWGKGIMTEAVKQICAYVFGSSDIIRIYAEPFAHNNASCRVLEKAGFQYEGTLSEYSNASEPPFYRLRATSDFNTLEPSQTQEIVMEP